MTAAADTEMEFTSRRGRTITEADKLHFKLDGDDYTLIRPKLTIGLGMLRLIEADTERSYAEIGADIAKIMLSVMEYIDEADPVAIRIDPDERCPHGNGAEGRECPVAGCDWLPSIRIEPRGRELLFTRLNDPEDGFDLPDLLPVFKRLAAVLFPGRPTIGQPVSGAGLSVSEPVAAPVDDSHSAPDATSGTNGTARLSSTSSTS